jgi:hypothetical protein
LLFCAVSTSNPCSWQVLCQTHQSLLHILQHHNCAALQCCPVPCQTCSCARPGQTGTCASSCWGRPASSAPQAPWQGPAAAQLHAAHLPQRGAPPSPWLSGSL